MNQLVKDFLKRYEKANAYADWAAMGKLYGDTFLFGGANGVQVVRKDDFLRLVPRMKAHFASLGLSETQLQTVETSVINVKYLLAQAAWKMTVRHLAGDRTELDAFATYVLERQEGGRLSIVFQIDHQDLATVIGGPTHRTGE
jgi:ketosteroid isomerase-like protein